MSLFSGTKLTDKDIDSKVQKQVRQIVIDLHNGRLDGPDACRQLTDLIVRTANTMTRIGYQASVDDLLASLGEPQWSQTTGDCYAVEAVRELLTTITRLQVAKEQNSAEHSGRLSE